MMCRHGFCDREDSNSNKFGNYDTDHIAQITITGR